MCKGNCLWLAALFRNIEAAYFCGMALMLAPFTEQRLAKCDLRCGDRRAGLGICSKQDGCGAAASCPSFQAFRSWTRVRHLSYGRCETNNPQSRCLEGAGQVLSLLGVNRRTLICQYQRINWTRKALLFSHAGSLHGAAGSVRFTSACLTLQSNLVLDVNPGEVPAFTALRNDWSGKANTRHSRLGRVDFESLQSRCDLVFAPSRTGLAQLPYAPAKLAAARDHLTLQTAESEPALPPDIPLQAGGWWSKAGDPDYSGHSAGAEQATQRHSRPSTQASAKKHLPRSQPPFGHRPPCHGKRSLRREDGEEWEDDTLAYGGASGSQDQLSKAVLQRTRS